MPLNEETKPNLVFDCNTWNYSTVSKPMGSDSFKNIIKKDIRLQILYI